MEDESSRAEDINNNLLRSLVIRGSRIRSNSTDTVLTGFNSGDRNEEENNENEEISDATRPTAAKSDSEVLPSDPSSEASTITSLQRDETEEQEQEQDQGQEQEQERDEEESCNDCPGGHSKFGTQELIPILNEIYKHSLILDDARLQTREHPAVQVDVSAITGPLQPREPHASVSEARGLFLQNIERILNSAEPSSHRADTGHFTAQQSTRLLELINSYIADMLYHCDRELFLRRHLALSEPEEGWIDVDDQIEFFRFAGYVLNDDLPGLESEWAVVSNAMNIRFIGKHIGMTICWRLILFLVASCIHDVD